MSTKNFFENYFKYDKGTGEFYWLVNRGSACVGDLAGTIRRDGYRVIKLMGKQYTCHRLAWLFDTCSWPTKSLDHINRTKIDNRISNLRLATFSQNSGNSQVRSDNTHGSKGLFWRKDRKKWRVLIGHEGKRLYLGLFEKKEDAAAAYDKASKYLRGEFHPSR